MCLGRVGEDSDGFEEGLRLLVQVSIPPLASRDVKYVSSSIADQLPQFLFGQRIRSTSSTKTICCNASGRGRNRKCRRPTANAQDFRPAASKPSLARRSSSVRTHDSRIQASGRVRKHRAELYEFFTAVGRLQRTRSPLRITRRAPFARCCWTDGVGDPRRVDQSVRRPPRDACWL